MRWILPVLIIVLTTQAADFIKSNWRSQVYLGVTPWSPTTFTPSTSLDTLEDKPLVPLTLGFVFNPFFTPLYKADIPITFWLGFEVGSFEFAELYNHENLDSSNHESLSWTQWTPTGLLGFSVNVIGDLDFRVLGGLGLSKNTFTYEIKGHPKVYSHSQFFAMSKVNLEYILVNDLFKGTDLKMSFFYKHVFTQSGSMQAVPLNPQPDAEQEINDLTIQSIEKNFPRIGIEFSLEFGRESRKDRKSRFHLNRRDDQLRANNLGMDTLTEWDCMAIERDYRLYLEISGDLGNVRHKFTMSQYTDVLESFLAFCEPEDLYTKEKLYANLDQNKVKLKKYQISQEDSRYKQVMASNDLKYLKMFLQYYPNSKYRGSIESKMVVLEDYESFRQAREGNSFKDYLTYMKNNPEGHYLKEAETGIFNLVRQGHRIKDYQIYMKKFPQGMFVNEARKAMHELMRQQ